MEDSKKIILVAETGSDISIEDRKRHGIFSVPMHVSFGDITVDDGTFPPERVVEYYRSSGKLPKTSGISPEDFALVFDRIHGEYPDAQILYLAYSAVTTCSYQSACIAAEGRSYVKLLDTKSVSAGQNAVVTSLAEELEQHPQWGMEEALAETGWLIKKIRMCFIPNNMEFLRAGGRVSNAVALCGDLLGLHPQIEILDGYLKATKKHRGKMEKIIPRLIRDFTKQNGLKKDKVWLICSPGLKEEYKEIAEKEAAACGFEQMKWVMTGGVITTHGGPGAFGLAGFYE